MKFGQSPNIFPPKPELVFRTTSLSERNVFFSGTILGLIKGSFEKHAGKFPPKVQIFTPQRPNLFGNFFSLYSENIFFSIGSLTDDERNSLKRAERFAKSPTLLTSKSENC